MSATSQIEHELAELELSLIQLEDEPRVDDRERERTEELVFELRTEVQWQMAEELERELQG